MHTKAIRTLTVFVRILPFDFFLLTTSATVINTSPSTPAKITPTNGQKE